MCYHFCIRNSGRFFIVIFFFLRFFKLFAKHKKDDETLTPLPYLMNLLLNEKVQFGVVACIHNILEKLLTLEAEKDEEKEEAEEPMEVDEIELNAACILNVDEEGLKKLNRKNFIFNFLFPAAGKWKFFKFLF